MADDDETLLAFVRRLPKVELHPHLNGCIREATLFELAAERSVELSSHHFGPSSASSNEDPFMYNVRPRSLKDCFDMFAEIPKCVDDLPALERIVGETLVDFAEQETVYLELRSTPKRLYRSTKDKSTTADKQVYIETMLAIMKDFEEQERLRFAANPSGRLPMHVRFICAIDRSLSMEQAEENIDLAIRMAQQEKRIVGVDLGGNPTKGDFRIMWSLFTRARVAGLKVTLHCAEIACDDGDPFDEASAMLEFKPDRLGHALLLPDKLRQRLRQLNIPVETCPTSNVMTLELAHRASGHLVDGLSQHPQLEHWLDWNHPLAIGTDDPGVFDTTPSQELYLLGKAFGVSRATLATIVVNSIDHAFCQEETKRTIKAAMLQRVGRPTMKQHICL